MKRLHPVSSDKKLIRLGPNRDGGYLVPDDLAGIEACFSPGVGNVYEFEKDCARSGMKVFIADKSVENLKSEYDHLNFTRKHVSTRSNDNFMTLDSWVASSILDKNSDLLLQMDIEGSEYEVFLSTSDVLLQRFRIIVVEFHMLDQLWNRPFFRLARSTFVKILQTHKCVHIHPNNVRKPIQQKGLSIPPLMEFTFLRKDRIRGSIYQKIYPNQLDCDNTLKSAVPLPKCWYNSEIQDDVIIERRIARQQMNLYGEHVLLNKKNVDEYIYTAEDEKRIEYYLGDIGKGEISLDKETNVFRPYVKPYRLLIMKYQDIFQAAISNKIIPGYTLPLLNVFSLFPDAYKKKLFLCYLGDDPPKNITEGVIAKARKKDDLSYTLLKLNPHRHWGNISTIKSLDIEYQQKKDMAIWRGATTGNKKKNGKRIDLVNRYFEYTDYFDVGYSKIVQGKNEYAHLIKDFKTIEEQLQYKLLISLEGNDLASGLSWMLYSNSVVMMPKPSIGTWMMEDTLEPFVHYIPLADDFSDAEEQFDWALNNEAECLNISKNASRFIHQFLDPRREVLIECEVMRRYLDNIDIH